MNFLKLFLIILVSISGYSCANQNFNFNLLKEKTGREKGIILSCVRCACMIDALEMNSDFLNTNKIPVLADPKCFQPGSFITAQLNQPLIDSIFEDNYNLILFNAETSKFRVVKTEEAEDLALILRNFFD